MRRRARERGGEQKPLSDRNTILRRVGVPDVMTHAKFSVHRFRGVGVSGGVEFPTFPLIFIDFRCRPYNTLVLPCQYMIIIIIIHQRRRCGLPKTSSSSTSSVLINITTSTSSSTSLSSANHFQIILPSSSCYNA